MIDARSRVRRLTSFNDRAIAARRTSFSPSFAVTGTLLETIRLRDFFEGEFEGEVRRE
jgi:hypothetical protein